MQLSMKEWGIKNRVLVLTLIPTIAVSLLLGTYFIYTRLSDLDVLLEERGMTTARQLIPALVHGVYTENKNLLRNLASSTLEETDVRAITIYSRKRLPLVHAGPQMYRPLIYPSVHFPSSLRLRQTQKSIRFTAPIFADDLQMNAYSDNTYSVEPSAYRTINNKNIIGWIELELSNTNTTIKKYQTLLASALLILLALLTNGLLALRMSRDVTEPILELTNVVNLIKDGNLDARVNTGTGGELHILESGINSMAESLTSAYEEMQQSVDQATEDLRATLETIEIQNIELDMARKEALEASRIKSEFLANMSHEIRTPLNGIIGFTNLLLKSSINDRQLDHLTTIQKSSDSLLAIINDILDFSKIEAGKLIFDHINMDLREVIEDVLTMLAPSAQEKRLELVPLIYSDTPTQLIGDPLRLKQILTNLVSNAVKFTNSGNIIVRAMLEDTQNQQALLKISITDTGIGLSAQQQSSLFNAFNQGDTSTTRQYGGTGLGLVISKRLVEQMGGDIGLESEVGQGSTFWFTVRIDISQTDDKDSLSLLKNKRIILCEEHPKTKLAISHLLTEWHTQTIEVDDPYQLEQIFTQTKNNHQPIDCIIIGISQQTQPIEDLTKIIKNLQEKHHCKILVFNNTTEQNPSNKKLDQQADALLTKPIRHKDLYTALMKLINNQIGDVTQSNTAPSPNRSPRILAVDDNPANLKLVQTLLTDMGAETYTAESGVQALTLIKQHKFDLVFMDVQMPGMDGIETTSRIRSLESRSSHLPVIALTAHALAEEKQHLLAAGMDDYMAKPINENQLHQIILKFTGFHVGEPITQKNNIATNKETGTSDTASNVVVDINESIRLAGGKVDLAEELLNMLVNSFETDQQDINNAFENDDIDELLEKVHRMHGATRYCGVPSLRSTTENIETYIKLKETEKIGDSLENLNFEIDRIKQWHKNNTDAFSLVKKL